MRIFADNIKTLKGNTFSGAITHHNSYACSTNIHLSKVKKKCNELVTLSDIIIARSKCGGRLQNGFLKLDCYLLFI